MSCLALRAAGPTRSKNVRGEGFGDWKMSQTNSMRSSKVWRVLRDRHSPPLQLSLADKMAVEMDGMTWKVAVGSLGGISILTGMSRESRERRGPRRGMRSEPQKLLKITMGHAERDHQ